MIESNLQYELVISKRRVDASVGDENSLTTVIERFSDVNIAIAALLSVELPMMDRDYCKSNELPFFIENAHVRGKEDHLIFLGKVDNDLSYEVEGFKVGVFSRHGYIPEELLSDNLTYNLIDHYPDWEASCLFEYLQDNEEFCFKESYLTALPSYREKTFENADLDEELPYSLQLIGKQLTADQHTQDILEERRFSSLPEAFCALVSMETNHFDEEAAYQAEVKKDYDSATIINKSSGEAEVRILRLGADNNDDELPTKGIYLLFDREVADFEKQTNIKLSHFGEYDPQNVALLISRYEFEDGVKLIDEPALAVLRHTLQQLVRNMYNDDRKPYVLEVRSTIRNESPLASEESANYAGVKQYFFPDPKRALLSLIGIDPYKLDPELYKRAGSEQILQASIVDSLGQKKAAMEYLPYFSLNQSDQSRIYLILPEGRSFWAVRDVDFSVFNFAHKCAVPSPYIRTKEHIPITYSSLDRDCLVSRDEVQRLKLQLEGHRNRYSIIGDTTPHVPAYLLEVVKVVSQGFGEKTLAFDRISISSIEDGIRQMEGYPHVLFKAPERSGKASNFYIDRIRLIDQADGRIIINRLSDEAVQQDLKSIYQVGEKDLTVELIIKLNELATKSDHASIHRLVILPARMEDMRSIDLKRFGGKLRIGPNERFGRGL